MSRVAIRLLSCVFCLPMIHSVAVGETLITFEGLVNGQVVTNQFAGVGLTISAINDNAASPDAAVIFNSSLTGTSDPGLEGPAPNSWSAGNINANEVLGNLLIIQANDDISGGVAADPQSASGRIFLAFSTPITSFGFDAIDIDPGDANLSSVAFYRNNVLIQSFNGVALQGLDPTLQAGNNSANRVLDITAAQLGVSDFNGVVFTMDRCTIAVDNLRFNLVPEAGSLSLMAIGACTLVGYGFRRSRQGKAA